MPDIGAAFGNNSSWPGGQATVPVTDLSAHVDGGQTAAGASDNTTTDQKTVLYGSAAIVAAALALLWFFGAFALRGLPSL